MSNIHELSPSQGRIDEASLWIAKLDKGLSPNQELELSEWLSLHPENYRVFMELAQLWDRMDALSRLSEICPEFSAPRRSRNKYVWPVAASILLAVSLAIWMQSGFSIFGSQDKQGTMMAADMYQTAIGEQSQFGLPDGTQIVLNTNSMLTMEFTRQNRLLILQRGEMHVRVAHDPSRPLSVVVGGKVVQAVGTEFNVEITSDDNIELVVTEGVVMVGVLDGSIVEFKSDKPVILMPHSTLVAAGQEIVIEANENELGAIETEDIDTEEIAVKLSWREGNLIFRGESLEDAVSEVGRYTAVEFIFLDEKSKKVRVAGLFKAGDVNGLLVALRQNFNISYEWVGDDKIVLSGQ